MNRSLLAVALSVALGCSSSAPKGNGGTAGGSGGRAGVDGAAGEGGAGHGSGLDAASGATAATDVSDRRDVGSGGDATDTAADTSPDDDARDAFAEARPSVPACPSTTDDAGTADAASDGSVDNLLGCPYAQDPLGPIIGETPYFNVSVDLVSVDGGGEFISDATFRWESRNARCGSSGGTFSDPTGGATTFTCALPGTTIVTVHLGRAHTACDRVMTWRIECQVGGNPAAVLTKQWFPSYAAVNVDLFSDGSALRYSTGSPPPPVPDRTYAAGSAEGTTVLDDLPRVDLSSFMPVQCASTVTSYTGVQVGADRGGPFECVNDLTPAELTLRHDIDVFFTAP